MRTRTRRWDGFPARLGIASTLPPAEFVNVWRRHGPTHHSALGVGHVAGTVEKVGRLLGVDVVRVE
jgi:L-arabinose isomerase